MSEENKSKADGIMKHIHAAATALMVFVGVFLFNTIINLRDEVKGLSDVKGDVDKAKSDIGEIKKKDAEDSVQWKLLNRHSEKLTDLEVQGRVQQMITQQIFDDYYEHSEIKITSTSPSSSNSEGSEVKPIPRPIAPTKKPTKIPHKWRKDWENAMKEMKNKDESYETFKQRHIQQEQRTMPSP